MAWRMIEQGERRWQVSIIAEQRGSSPQWSLVACFRSPGQRPIWAPTPVSAASKTALFTQAERMTDDTLLGLLAQAITRQERG